MGYRYNPFSGELDLVDTVTITPNFANQFVSDSGTAIPAAYILNLLGDATQGLTTSGAGNTVTFTNSDATTSQKGVAELATNAEAIAGTDSSRSIVPSSLKAKLGVQTQYGVLYGNGTTNALEWTATATAGQLLIGATGSAPAFANPTSTADTLAFTNGANTLNIDLSSDVQMTAIHGWNGSILESAAVTVTSDGVTILCNVEKSGGGDLTVVFSDGYYDWDTSPIVTVSLTAGTDVAPQLNYVYFLKSTKTLAASIVGWPATEHAPICTTICQSAASLQTEGSYKMHAWTDHVIATDNQGHIGDLNFWIRQQNATWKSLVTQTYTITPNGGSADNVTISTIAGVVLQLHDHAYPAFSAADDYYVINDSVAAYDVVTDLNALLLDSGGVSMSGKYFSLVLWGVISEDSGDCKRFINLPSGSYNTQAGVEADASGYANFNIPDDYKGTGFLISEFKLRHQAAASGTWTSIDEIDLRGLLPSVSPTGSTATPVEFADNTFRIFDDGDDTKKIAFQASGITPATTRTLTVQDADGIIALSGVANYGTGATTLTDHGVLVGSGTSPITPLAAATNGQLVIGSTTADPVVSAPSNGNNITWTLGAGTLEADLTGTTNNTIQIGNAGGSLTSLAAATNGQIPIGSTGTSPTVTAPSNGNNITWTLGAGTLEADLTGTTDNTVQIGNASGSLTSLAAATNGQLVIGSSGSAPSIAALASADATVTITNGAGTIDLSAPTGGIFAWTEVTGATQAAAVNQGYITNRGAGVTVTLPDTAAIGSVLRIAGVLGNWVLAQNAGETVHFGNQDTTTGAGGSLTATDASDCVELLCTTANTDWTVLSSIGNLTVT